MKHAIIKFLLWIARGVFSLRYKVHIEGLELLDKKHLHKKGGTLILPNHSAHIDPLILVFYLWPKMKMRPLAVEYMYRNPFLHFFMKRVGTLPIPDFETSINEVKLEKGEKTLLEIKKGLKKKQSFLLYPAGRLKLGSKEIIGGASATHDLVRNCPETNVVLVRTTGLWGSMFSRALTGRSPEFVSNMKKGIGIVLKNGIFFTPRRKISIKIEPNPEDFPWKSSRLDLNRYMENWYNQYPSHKEEGKILEYEPLLLVSYAFYKKDYPDVKQVKQIQKKRLPTNVSGKKQKDIYGYIASLSEVKEKDIQPKMNLAIDLGLDSLDIANIIAHLSDQYEVKSIHPEEVESVQDVLTIAEGKSEKVQGGKLERKYRWPEETNRPHPAMPEGKTIYESFLQRCKQMSPFAAMADDIIGVLSYKKLKMAVMVLALEIQKTPGRYQAIMLPASCGAYICILASLFAGKIPVMLNWTLGPRFLNEMMRVTGAKKVLTSWKFLERVSNVEFGELKDDLILLEDLKKNLSFFTKMKGLWISLKSNQRILRSLKLQKKTGDDVAVILFTSGTESIPKAVPLSHRNILSNQQSAMQCVTLKSDDTIYGILPPFHSFGFSVAGIFPILAGMKVVFYPDPTDSFSLASGIENWKVTLFCGAPSFISGLLSTADKKQLKTMRLVVTGAEKAPESLFRKVSRLGTNKVTVEGYGITECSPIISLSRPQEKRVGVGKLVPGVDACTIHPETSEPLKPGEEGEICIHGPNVFSGYLEKRESPFIKIQGKYWYRTGDLGRIDNDSHIILSGRLKRFAKIGGEMVSLGGIEEVICHKFLSKAQQEEGVQLAVCVDEKDASKSLLILITTFDIDKKQVNEVLKKEGFSRLIKIAVVVKIKTIPLLGTGKVDYRTLQTYI